MEIFLFYHPSLAPPLSNATNQSKLFFFVEDRPQFPLILTLSSISYPHLIFTLLWMASVSEDLVQASLAIYSENLVNYTYRVTKI